MEHTSSRRVPKHKPELKKGRASKPSDAPPNHKNKLKYSKAGREDMKEAKLKSESWRGKTAVKRQQGGSAAASSSNAQPLGEKPVGEKPKTGFVVGPRLAKGNYFGKFDKIKAGLIHNAKIKKQYAKMLKREGINGGDASMDTEDNGDDDAGSVTTEGATPRRSKGKGRARNPDEMEQDGPSPTMPVLRKRKSSEIDKRERAPDEMQSDNDEDDQDGPAPGPDQSIASGSVGYVHPTRKGKDAEPEHKRRRISDEELEAKREKRMRDRHAWGKKTRKGQPNLGSRMDVLLGKIESKVSR